MSASTTGSATFVVVGCGSIGSRHLGNLLACGVERILAVDPSPERRAEVAERHSVETSERFVVGELQPGDVVVVAAPSSTHAEIAVAAARAGCHLFVEKPLATTVDDGAAVVAAAGSAGVVGMVGSNWKFHPSFRRMKAVLEGGALGRVTYARADFGSYLPDWHPWEDHRRGYSARLDLGGGVLLDSHDFDYLRWFLGEPTEVACAVSHVPELELETEAVAAITLRFGAGLLAQLYLSYAERTYRRQYLFAGSDATLRWDYDERRVVLAGPRESHEWAEPEGYDLNEMYLEQTRHFLACLEERRPPVTTLEDGLTVLRAIDAARTAASGGRTISIGTGEWT